MKREKTCLLLVMTMLLLISLPTGIQAQDQAASATELPLKNGIAASGDLSPHASMPPKIEIERIAYFPSKSLAGLSGLTGMNASLAAARFNTQQAPAASRGKRSKKLIIIGAGLLGGGAALMLAGPTSTSSSPYTTSYNTKIYGGVIAASGGVALWAGLKRIH